jgi:hypothetical protein
MEGRPKTADKLPKLASGKSKRDASATAAAAVDDEYEEAWDDQTWAEEDEEAARDNSTSVYRVRSGGKRTSRARPAELAEEEVPWRKGPATKGRHHKEGLAPSLLRKRTAAHLDKPEEDQHRRHRRHREEREGHEPVAQCKPGGRRVRPIIFHYFLNIAFFKKWRRHHTFAHGISISKCAS